MAVRKALVPLADPRGAGERRPCPAHRSVASEAALPVILRVGWTFGPLSAKFHLQIREASITIRMN